MIANEHPKQSDNTVSGEHEVQLRLLQAVEQLLQDASRKDELAEALDRLVDFTSVHFLSEQLLMRLYAYPQQGAHEARHAELMERTGELRDRLLSGDALATPSLAATLRQSVVEHIAREDAAFSAYLARVSHQPAPDPDQLTD